MTDKTLKQIERRLTRLEAAVFGQQKKKPVRNTASENFDGPSGGIRLLISKRFFRQKRSLADVRGALAKHDYHYVIQVVHTALSRLSTIGGPLVSLREGGKKLYVERK